MFTRIVTLTNANCLLYISHNKNIFLTSCNLKSLKKYIDFSKVPKLNDQDLEVQYCRGAGPGGQATNKTNNAVILRHKPTGIIVKCHQTRSQFKNKEMAKKNLINKLDLFYNKEDAVENQERRIMKNVSLEKKRRQKKLADLKLSFKEHNDLNNS